MIAKSVRGGIALLALVPAAFGQSRTPTASAEPRRDVIVNVRDFGATGDGRAHSVKMWIDGGRFRNLAALRTEYPFVDNLDWSTDEAAFAKARDALPPEGGTIFFPAGHYVAARASWTIQRDRVRLVGEGAERTILSTTPNIADALVLAPYRHGGWVQGASREYPFASDSGRRGDTELRLRVPAWSGEFAPGEIVFIRNGACRFDQDYGEFNEIAGVGDDGTLRFVHPFARDYTLERFNWANETAEPFAMPREGRAISVAIRTGDRFFLPGRNDPATVGESVFRVVEVKGNTVRLHNPGRGNPPPGTVIPTGAKLGKARTVTKLTRTTRDFRCEGLQIVGRRKTLNLSNSYGVYFADCIFVRDLRDGGFSGGLTIDGDGGRFATFERCTLRALPAAGMQFARSFGGISFVECHFIDANVSFTEFNFDAEVVNCTFDVTGTRHLPNVVIAGKSCGDIRIVGNRIRAVNMPAVFDAVMDIHSQRHGGEGDIVFRDNVIETENVPRLFTTGFPRTMVVEGNRHNGATVEAPR